ncbi:MAG: L,D-transpeptidase [Pseudomonadota bacterium]|nr:L,D-transpeptidase [Pseudomonadota bacterium]
MNPPEFNPESIRLVVDIAAQQLRRFQDEQLTHQYSISTAKNGVGSRNGSEKTPLGEHYIRAKIGANAPSHAVFVGRRPTGEIYSEALAAQYPNRDWILTRILWLCGKEVGVNRGGEVDSMRRYIYLHGTPDSEPMGTALSHGCIRMRNADIVELFELTPAYCSVTIVERC